MRISNKAILVNGDMSGDLSTVAYPLNQVYGYAIQLIFGTGGAPVGSFKLQGSNDPGLDPSTVVNWNDIEDSEFTVASGNKGWNYNGSFYNWVRVVYDATSGTGSLNIIINTKGN